MQHSPNEIKEKLLRALDKDYNVVDMAEVVEVIALLEKTPITKDELERTRLGKYINELRKKTTNEMLSRRAKNLVRRWRKLIIPQDSSSVLNGEHLELAAHHAAVGNLTPCLVMSSHLPGPGPGPGLMTAGSKPASPSLMNHHRSLKGISGLAQSSPGNSQCSSASTSPSVTTGVGRLGSSRPSTPSVSSSPYVSKFMGVPGGTGMVDSRLGSSLHAFKPVSPAPMTAAMNKIAPAGGSSAKQIVNRQVTSPPSHCSPTFDHRTRCIGLGAKRPRTDEDESCDSQGRQSSVCLLKNSSSPPPVGGLINGVDAGDSMDSVPSCIESLGGDPSDSKDASSGATNLAKFRKRNSRIRPEKCDTLKEKLASQMRTPKVKTTAELIQELKARNSSGSCSAIRSSPVLGVSGNGEDHTRVTPADSDSSLVHTRKVVYSSLLGTDEDMTRNKTELMEKFLKDSIGTEASSLNERLSREYASGKESPRGIVRNAQTFKDVNDPVDDILATLPPVNINDIKWDDDDNDGGELDIKSELSVQQEVTDEHVQRLLVEDWEYVNGISDYKGDFRRWNEIVTQKSYNDDSLHILPYVDID